MMIYSRGDFNCLRQTGTVSYAQYAIARRYNWMVDNGSMSLSGTSLGKTSRSYKRLSSKFGKKSVADACWFNFSHHLVRISAHHKG